MPTGAVFAAPAGKLPELKFLKPAEILSLGIKLNVMPDSRESPIAPPQTFCYTMQTGTETLKKDMFSPLELWRAAQGSARWLDPHGNALTVTAITSSFPAGKFTRQHLERSEFDEIMEAADKLPSEPGDSDLAGWINSFTGVEIAEIQPVPHAPTRMKALKSVLISPSSAGYVFCLSRPEAQGVSPAMSSWFFVKVDWNPKFDTKKAQKIILEQLIPSLQPCRFVQKKVVASSAFQAGHFARIREKSPEFIASRQQVAASIKDAKDWWFVETENYIFLSNLKAKYGTTVKDLQEHIEYLRDAFEQFMPPRKELTSVSVIRVFGSSGEYVGYVGKDFSWSAGLWSPMRKELVIRPPEFGTSKMQKDQFFRVVFHEGLHQYLFYSFDMKEPAVWFNEGHADFFSAAVITDKKFSVPEAAHNAKVLEEMMAKKSISISTLIRMKHEEFYRCDDKTRKDHYALAWAVVYYLRKGVPLEKNSKYASILDRYGDALWETGDGAKATDAAFDGIDIDKFQRDFILFWLTPARRSAALRNNIFKGFNPATK